jgi:hypothetical protein
MKTRILKTYNDHLPAPGRPVTTYEFEVDGEVVGHICKYERTWHELKKYDGIARKVGSGRTVVDTYWRGRIFGRPEGREFSTRRECVTDMLSNVAGV